MPRGGAREGAGRRSTWPSGCKFTETRLIRVPARLADHLLYIARLMDAGLDTSEGIFCCNLPPCGETPTGDNPTTLPKSTQDTLPQMVPGVLFEIETKSEAHVLQFLTSSQLLSRLGLASRGTLNNKKKKCYPDNPAEFHKWSRGRDPDGVAWDYHDDDKRFHPVHL